MSEKETRLDHNLFLSESPLLTTKDVAILPGKTPGILSSRKDAEQHPFIYSAPMDLVTGYELTKKMLENNQYPVVSRFLDKEELEVIVKDFGQEKNIWFAVGFNDAPDILNLFAKVAEEQNWDESYKVNLALDIAHGDMEKAHQFTATMAALSFTRYIMSGSICTPEAALRAVKLGLCTHLRVGVGPGAACTTRVMTGVGVPNLSAVYTIARELELHGIKNVEIIADGGIKEPGDANKYLVAGATAIMLGSVLSKTMESPGWVKKPKEVNLEEAVSFPRKTEYTYTKVYRGQASASFQKDQFDKVNACPEGATSKSFEWQGDTVQSVIDKYYGGMASCISYVGIKNQKDMYKADLMRITPSGWLEGTPHGV